MQSSVKVRTRRRPRFELCRQPHAPRTLQVFGPVKPQSVPVFASLAYNPQTQLGDDFGTKVSNLDSAHKQVKHAYAPETILEALQQLWLTGGVQNPINRYLRSSCSTGRCSVHVVN